MRQLLAKQHQMADALAQVQADLAREKLHSDLKVGIELRRLNPRIGGFRNGQVVYAAPPLRASLRRGVLIEIRVLNKIKRISLQEENHKKN